MVGTIVISVLQAWFMFRTGGCLLTAILMHLAINEVPGLFGAQFNDMIAACCLIAAAIVLLDRDFRTGKIAQPGAAA